MTPSYIDTLEEDNPKGAALLKSVKVDHIEKSISAILTLNTVAHTLGSLGAGAQAVIVFGNAWFGVFSGVMTLIILIGTEIIPKPSERYIGDDLLCLWRIMCVQSMWHYCPLFG